ncbi:hypothetical protein [Duganella sp. Root1480D1]|uniref:hypothetical protein n=1 Tax=Duganella sp. Root1480D1 TaxID=1736471 RepID=UPI00070B980F|nr:hypothetical protein [Duganella sp. Root1480D1]KQZ30487.1 hypothetical protein ASD58_10790 [Duganella sp. Root1480D1]
MSSKFHFTFEADWRSAPGAFLVHVPAEGVLGVFVPAAPIAVPHKGFAMLHVEFEAFDLLFSSSAQIDHYIDVLSKTVLPTSRHLTEARASNVGPNQHWLSRLPGELKSPRTRPALVKALLAAKDFAAANSPNNSFNPDALTRAG